MRDYPNVILGHGGGGKLSAELIEHVFLPAFGNDLLGGLGDSTVVEVAGARLAFSTDSYVVHPLFFPGGSIGDLAVNGTVNDLAMSGARPLYLSAGFIIEEGLPIDSLVRVAKEMSAAAKAAGVQIVTGDTKVIERGRGDGCYINTSGIGVVPGGVDIHPRRAKTGDAVLLSGTMGDHGMAIMSEREGLAFEAEIKSDSAPLATMVSALLDACSDVHVLRDPTRGGLAASLNEIASAGGCGVIIEESAVPVRPTVRSACEILGLDPLHVANEGKLVCFVPADQADAALAAMRKSPHGEDAAVIGRVVEDHPGTVAAVTPIGAKRVVTVPVGEQLPRIC
ncbi:MAG: hydrogenase expression/formation protein HypE [Planctomycetota bacterium]